MNLRLSHVEPAIDFDTEEVWDTMFSLKHHGVIVDACGPVVLSADYVRLV